MFHLMMQWRFNLISSSLKPCATLGAVYGSDERSSRH